MTTDEEVPANDTDDVLMSQGAAPEFNKDSDTETAQYPEPTETTEPTETIKLDQFLKLADLVGSGGEAKHLIRSGSIFVNGEEETRRGRKLRHGDVVTFDGEDYVIETAEDSPSK